MYVQVITHPLYSSTTINNDIALLKLSSRVTFTPRISPVCLAPSTINILPGTRCFTTGWGQTETTSKSAVKQRWTVRIIVVCYMSHLFYFFLSFSFLASPMILQQTGIPITSPAVCRQIWGQNTITDAMICAGGAGSSSCMVREDRSGQTHYHINVAAVLKCVFSTGWFWWSSGVWAFRGLDSGGLCVLGNQNLWHPFPSSVRPHLPAALLDRQNYRFQLEH